MSEETFEGWAIVELFGHNMIAGLLSEQSIGGAAVYAITPTTEEVVRAAAAKLAVRLDLRRRAVGRWA